MLILDTILGVLRSLAPSNRRYHSFRNYSLEAFSSVLPQHEKVGGVPVRDSTPGRTEIVQLELGRLIPIFQHTGIMLHDVDCAQFGVALKLDGSAHFSTGIATVNIPSPSSYAANRG